jgi:RNA polymerase sigma-70 factor (ECF subfamily)
LLTAARAASADATARREVDLAGRALVVARRTALGVLGDREAAADVAQEVALQAVRRRQSLREPAALDAWVHRIAVAPPCARRAAAAAGGRPRSPAPRSRPRGRLTRPARSLPSSTASRRVSAPR